MSLSFPNAVLYNGFPLATTKFNLVPRQSKSRQGNGTLIGVDFGLPVWAASYQSAPAPHSLCVEMEALLNSLDGLINLINLGDTRRQYPAAYPTGAFADTGSITTWGASGKSVIISGLAAGFVISRGDYFHYTLGGKRYLHQAVEAATASGGGVTPDFEIRPHYPTNAAGTTAVVFTTPTMRAVLDPGSIDFNDAGGLTGTVAFSVSQSF